MNETLGDYVSAYKKHKSLRTELMIKDHPWEKEDKLMESIIQGAILKFVVKREEFLKKVNE